MQSIILLQCLFLIVCIRCIIVPLNKKIKGELYFYLIFLILIVTFRPETLPDYDNYQSSFYHENERYEPLFRGLYILIQSFCNNFLVLIFIVAVLTVTLKILAINRMSVFPALSVLVWMSYMLLFQDMIAIRAALAASISLWVIYFRCKKNAIGLVISILLAILSHYTAIILLVIPFLSVSKPRKKIYISMLLAAIILAGLGFSFTNLFQFTGIEVYDRLMNTYMVSDSTHPFKPLQLLRLGICVTLWVSIRRININNYIILLLKTYTLGCIIFFTFWGIAGVAIRLSELFIITEILVIPLLALSLGKKNINIMKYIPIVISISIFTMELRMFNLV